MPTGQVISHVRLCQCVSALSVTTSRPFPHFLLSEEEQAYFASKGEADLDEAVYCVIRNHVLAKWQMDVKRLVTEEQARPRKSSCRTRALRPLRRPIPRAPPDVGARPSCPDLIIS